MRAIHIEDGQVVKHIACDAHGAGDVAALLLQCALQASQHLISVLPEGQDYSGRVVPISRLALGQNQSPHHQTLVLGIGAAKIGFAIPNEQPC